MLYIIVGDGQCGKSSLTRALTGIYRTATTRIRQTNRVDMHIRVWPQSAQEARKSPNQVLNEINNANAGNVLITLRYFPAPSMVQFDAIDYFDLISLHHNVVQIVFMGGETNVNQFRTSVPSNVLNLCTGRPINGNANMVRGWWGWE